MTLAAAALYAANCAVCHGPDRLGLTGPALLPENLERLSPSAALQVIAKGRMATQMPAFGNKLSAVDAASCGVIANLFGDQKRLQAGVGDYLSKLRAVWGLKGSFTPVSKLPARLSMIWAFHLRKRNNNGNSNYNPGLRKGPSV